MIVALLVVGNVGGGSDFFVFTLVVSVADALP